MKYMIGDTVLYNMQGTCKVKGVEEKDFTGEVKMYYVLEPTYDNKSTMYVPVELEDVKLKHILSVEGAYELIKAMPDENTIWIEDGNARRGHYKSIISSGDRVELVKLIKTLYSRKQDQKESGKKLYKVDEQFMKDAEQLLYEELAYVLNIGVDQVIPFITEQIEVPGKE